MNRLAPKLATYAPRNAVALAPRAWGGEFLVVAAASDAFELEGDAAVVRITGPLVHHNSWCFDSYEAIEGRIRAACESAASRVILKIDSPGGDVSGCFELARTIRGLAEKKPIIAFADGMMASAAYALGCACTSVYASATSMVGSIGVIEAMVDVTAQDAAMGMRFVFARSGERKGDGNPHLPISKGAEAAMQSHVDGLASLFFALVSEMRGVDASAVEGLQAGIFLAGDALGNRLIDGVVSGSELVSGAIGENGGKAMAKKLTEYLASLAEGEDKEEAKKAKKALAALLAEDDGDGDEAPPKKEEAAASTATAAKAEEEPKKEEARAEEEKEMKAAASASLPEVVALAREVHALRAERAAEKDLTARAAIFAKRPDLGAETMKALAAVPTKDLQAVVDTFPIALNPAAAAQVQGTLGNTQTESGALFVSPTEASIIDAKMGFGRPQAKIENVGTELRLGSLTPEQARAHLAVIQGGK